MKGYVFPGQASQFEGMGKDMYEESALAHQLFEQANEIVGFRISDVMFAGSAAELKETKVTQPAVFLHSVIKVAVNKDDFQPDMVAGHSLGEFSALVAAGALSFEEGLTLVLKRALAMQKACEAQQSTMAAILGLEDEKVEEVCASITDEIVVPANYNCPGQLVISGTINGIDKAVAQLKTAGAKRALVLAVGGAFHSPLMASAESELAQAIQEASFKAPICPIYQNVDAKPVTDPEVIKINLINQLTAPVKWTQTMKNMIADGAQTVVEVGGTGKVLQGFFKRLDRRFPTSSM